MNGLHFEEEENDGEIKRLLTWDQMSAPECGDKPVKSLKLECIAGEVAILKVERYNLDEVGGINYEPDENGQITYWEEYAVGDCSGMSIPVFKIVESSAKIVDEEKE